jgi:hypothetical protein
MGNNVSTEPQPKDQNLLEQIFATDQKSYNTSGYIPPYDDVMSEQINELRMFNKNTGETLCYQLKKTKCPTDISAYSVTKNILSESDQKIIQELQNLQQVPSNQPKSGDLLLTNELMNYMPQKGGKDESDTSEDSEDSELKPKKVLSDDDTEKLEKLKVDDDDDDDDNEEIDVGSLNQDLTSDELRGIRNKIFGPNTESPSNYNNFTEKFEKAMSRIEENKSKKSREHFTTEERKIINMSPSEKYYKKASENKKYQ